MHLNYLPLRFTSDVFKGGVLPFDGNPKDLSTGESALSLKLRELRQQHGSTHVFHAAANSDGRTIPGIKRSVKGAARLSTRVSLK